MTRHDSGAATRLVQRLATVVAMLMAAAAIGTAATAGAAPASGAGRVTVFPSTVGPEEITAGPDGALWFTEAAANKIGRITTAGLSDRLMHVELERVFERNVIRHEYRSKRG